MHGKHFVIQILCQYALVFVSYQVFSRISFVLEPTWTFLRKILPSKNRVLEARVVGALRTLKMGLKLEIFGKVLWFKILAGYYVVKYWPILYGFAYPLALMGCEGTRGRLLIRLAHSVLHKIGVLFISSNFNIFCWNCHTIF